MKEFPAGKLKDVMALLRRVLPGAKYPIPPAAAPAPPPVLPARMAELVGDLMDKLTSHRPEPTPPPQGGGSFAWHEFTCAAGSRRYKLFIPPAYHGQKLPLLLMLHGCTQSPDDFATGTRMNQLAAEQAMFVAYPEQPRGANFSKCWNWFNPHDQHRGAGEPAILAGLTQQIMQDYAIEPDRVFVAGLSAGGAAAAVLGATYPELYAAIGVHSGLACGAASNFAAAAVAMRNGAETVRPNAILVPAIVFHGDADGTVSPINAAQVLTQAAAGTVLEKTAQEGHTPDGMGYTRTELTNNHGDCVLESWILHGAGHAWSGGDGAGSYTDPRGPDASAEMLRFFRAQK